jgi:hypothetical protein
MCINLTPWADRSKNWLFLWGEETSCSYQDLKMKGRVRPTWFWPPYLPQYGTTCKKWHSVALKTYSYPLELILDEKGGMCIVWAKKGEINLFFIRMNALKIPPLFLISTGLFPYLIIVQKALLFRRNVVRACSPLHAWMSWGWVFYQFI